MTTSLSPTPWDLSQVRDLVEKLSVWPKNNDYTHSTYEDINKKETFGNSAAGTLETTDIDEKDFALSTLGHIDGNTSSPAQSYTAVSCTGLGDFSKIFKLLADTTPPSVSISSKDTTNEEKSEYIVPILKDYASDGAAYVKPTARHGATVQHLDLPSADETLTDRTSDGTIHVQKAKLTKKQAKKIRKKEKLEQRKRANTLSARSTAEAVAFESEAEINSHTAPAKKASMHAAKNAAAKRKGSAASDTTTQLTRISQPVTNQTETAQTLETVLGKITSNVAPRTPILNPRCPQPLEETRSPSDKTIRPQTPTRLGKTEAAKGAIRFLPSSVPPKPYGTKPISDDSYDKQGSRIFPNFKQKQPTNPIIIRSVEDRNWALLMKLINDFWKDRTYLISPMNLTTHNHDPKGIHVFVDASNIFIGFLEQLKRVRGIPQHVQLPATGMSFDAIALLMERRRPVAKRVLVGSTPYMPAFDKAKSVGYECCILEKVYKARELTERQKYFKALDERYRNRTKVPPSNNVASANSNGNGATPNEGSLETNAPQFAPPRMIEQGVDEILHLKILESIVDTDEPGIIVLATGDAAMAEYSQGFMAMAERALKKGWTIELVTWSHLISSMYKRRQWTETWGERFKIIYLDDYVEELLEI